MFLHQRIGKSRQSGFSLVEIMVGIVIGMLAVIIIMQVFSTSEANKRNMTGGGDAQMNGGLALYGIERDVRAAGYGVNAFNLLGCSLSYKPKNDAAVTLNGSGIGPVTINPPAALVPAGDAKTDTLLVMYGNSNSPAEGDPTLAVSTSTVYRVSTPASFAANDYILAEASTRPSPCALTLDQVTSVNASTSTLNVKTGAAGMAANSVIFNLGQTLTVRAYAVRNGNLTVCDYTAYDCGKASYASPLNSTVWVPANGNIVSLRAQYGRDTSGMAASPAQMSGVVDTFDQTTPGSTADTSGLPPYCSWARALAVRLVLVARSPAFDKAAPTSASPTWTGTAANSTASPGYPLNTATPIDLSGQTNWQNYRYKTNQTTVPLRNVVWQGSQSGC
ncbi:PilW family protein [Variovorax sp. dw_308]|uniref:PilW family protein n=1 Tax=Variovorax sp. dw_308 TaxID=2721546 RepID=UPI001C4653BB|nr:PilW family protein [Variovorax sp. dw_308]